MASPDFQIFKPRKNIMLHIFYEQKSEKKEDEKKKQAWFNNTKFILCEHNSQRSHGWSFQLHYKFLIVLQFKRVWALDLQNSRHIAAFAFWVIFMIPAAKKSAK